MTVDDQDRNVDYSYLCTQSGSIDKDRISTVVYITVDDQDLNVYSCRCSRPGSTDKDRRHAVVLVVDMLIDDQDRKVNSVCRCSRQGSTD